MPKDLFQQLRFEDQAAYETELVPQDSKDNLTEDSTDNESTELLSADAQHEEDNKRIKELLNELNVMMANDHERYITLYSVMDNLVARFQSYRIQWDAPNDEIDDPYVVALVINNTDTNNPTIQRRIKSAERITLENINIALTPAQIQALQNKESRANQQALQQLETEILHQLWLEGKIHHPDWCNILLSKKNKLDSAISWADYYTSTLFVIFCVAGLFAAVGGLPNVGAFAGAAALGTGVAGSTLSTTWNGADALECVVLGYRQFYRGEWRVALANWTAAGAMGGSTIAANISLYTAVELAVSAASLLSWSFVAAYFITAGIEFAEANKCEKRKQLYCDKLDTTLDTIFPTVSISSPDHSEENTEIEEQQQLLTSDSSSEKPLTAAAFITKNNNALENADIKTLKTLLRDKKTTYIQCVELGDILLRKIAETPNASPKDKHNMQDYLASIAIEKAKKRNHLRMGWGMVGCGIGMTVVSSMLTMSYAISGPLIDLVVAQAAAFAIGFAKRQYVRNVDHVGKVQAALADHPKFNFFDHTEHDKDNENLSTTALDAPPIKSQDI